VHKGAAPFNTEKEKKGQNCSRHFSTLLEFHKALPGFFLCIFSSYNKKGASSFHYRLYVFTVGFTKNNIAYTGIIVFTKFHGWVLDKMILGYLGLGHGGILIEPNIDKGVYGVHRIAKGLFTPGHKAFDQ
jgi:hypothetical protein